VRGATRALAMTGLAVAGVAAPATASLGPLRRRLAPRLAGIGDAGHIALTYDDGPDPLSTPHFLDLLEDFGRTATFFLLGAHVARHPDLVIEMAQRGHELAVHGWEHECVLTLGPGRLLSDLRDTATLIEDVSGQRPRWYRPPYGVLSTPALLAARATGLRTVLWSAWGRDWEARATPPRIVRTVERTLGPGGTVLLHDTDRTSATGSWQHTLQASRVLLKCWADGPVAVGRLGDHGLRAHRSGTSSQVRGRIGPPQWSP
jgi:peptidoglycan/xylan/chitin deacetylase (PgdA/CDA1 family)